MRIKQRTASERELESLLSVSPLPAPHPSQAQRKSSPLSSQHIHLTWASLRRDNTDILDIAADPKWPKQGRFPVYVSAKEDPARIRSVLSESVPESDMEQIEILRIPEGQGSKRFGGRHGSLYLPYPYAVPGGRFQEMYGWDSWFILLGLLKDGRVRLAQNMVDNFVYSIHHYGLIPNGSRTYYLTRSQLPFLSSMILSVFSHTRSLPWLRSTLSSLRSYHAYWTTGDHFTPSTGLSRFWDSNDKGSVPPEVDSHEKGRDGKTHHQLVEEWFREHAEEGTGGDYDVRRMWDAQKGVLTPEYYDNDRAMRESGFDTSRRFGLFGANVLAYNPVCLNSLLFKFEKDLAKILRLLGGDEFELEAREWDLKASIRRERINTYLWNEEDGLYYDYDHTLRAPRTYAFGTTFLPLWTGLASPSQAERVASEGLRRMEVAAGLATSDRDEGVQWDMPYVWAPLQFFAVEGLLNYGYKSAADRLAINFCSTILDTFLKTGEIWEKYHGKRRDEFVDLSFGYAANETGFGWSNAFFIIALDRLDKEGRERVRWLDGMEVPKE